MKRNKYIVFVMIGFEMVALVMAAIFIGDLLVEKGYSPNVKALLVVVGLFLWFISLFFKLKSLQKSDD